MSNNIEENNESIISISVKDIMKEISNFTGISEENLGISKNIQIGYWGIHNFLELISLINSENQNLGYYKYDKDKYFDITIYSDKNLYSRNFNQQFCYELKFKLDLDEIQADGKTMKEHCREQLYFVDGPDMHCTGIQIDDIENLNYKVNLKELENLEDSKYFYPVELFKNIIINIIENKNINKQKKLK